MIRAVVLDVGETLISDERTWARWAAWLGVPRYTMSALVGAVVALGMDNAEAVRLIRPGADIAAERAAMEAAGHLEELGEDDLYPDVRNGLAALHDAGFAVYVAGNQTARAAGLLRALDLPVDGIVTSGEWGVAKPSPAFFERILRLTGTAPQETVYVGDHPANDVTPAALAGLRTCLLRRGPWGYLWGTDPAVRADWVVGSLLDLPGVLRSA